jgi:ankyrin repeat protein
LEPFDQKISLNPGASYPDDRGVDEDDSGFFEDEFDATRELVEAAGLEYNNSDLIDLHDRTNGVPLLIAAICSDPDTMSLQKELNNRPSKYSEFKRDIQNDFVRSLSDQELRLLTKTSVMPILTKNMCSIQSGIPEARIIGLLSNLCEKGKLISIQTEYPNDHSYRCHDFYREFLIECASLNERELRQEAAVNCLRLAFEHHTPEFQGKESSLTRLQLDRFDHQLHYISQSKSFPEIGDIVASGIDHSKTDLLELLSSYHEADHCDYDLGEYLKQIV